MRVPFQINSLNKALLGIFHIPDKQSEKIKVIIMCYGLNGNRVEQHRMSVKFAEACEENHICLVRFDYTDAGISEGDFSDTLISNRVKNVEDVVDYVRGCFNKCIEIFLVGFSDGAKVAVNSLTQIGECQGIILWNPIVNIDVKSMTNKSKTDNHLKLDNATKKPYKPLFGLKLNLQMIRELMNDQTKELLKNSYRKLFIFGEKDVYTAEINKYFRSNKDLYPNSEFVEIKNSGHLFSDKKYEEEVIRKTIKFVK
jgi:alpha/beta superfamily hydrolase